MAKKANDLPGVVSPASLWGKPLPRARVPGSAVGKLVPKVDDYADDDNEGEEAAAEDEVATDAELSDDTDVADDDGDEFLPEEGDEDAISDDEDGDDPPAATTAVDEVEHETPRPTVSAAHVERTAVMAEKKSNADHVRDEIAKRQETGESLRGVDIVAALKSRRIVVSPAQVSQLLKKAGVAQKPRGSRRKPVAASAPATTSTATEERSRIASKVAKVGDHVSPTAADAAWLPQSRVQQLHAAKVFVAACNGSLAEATSTLEMFNKLAELTG